MKTLILAYPGCTMLEVALAAEFLDPKFPVELAAPRADAIIQSGGLRYAPTLSYADVEAADYAYVLVPGGNPDTIVEDDTLCGILRASDARGSVLAGICAGVLVMANAGVLRGRNITHNYTKFYSPAHVAEKCEHFWEGSRYCHDSVIVDEHIITALPYGHIDLAFTLAARAKTIPTEKIPALRSFYMGEYVFGPHGE